MTTKHTRSKSNCAHPNWAPPSNPIPKGYRRSTRNASNAVIFCLIGLVGGLAGGLLGIGGGSAIAPLLLLTGTLRPAQVSGTTLSTVLLISMVGSGAYAALGHLNLELAWPIAMGSVVGCVLGAFTSKRLSMRLMIAMFLVILPYLRGQGTLARVCGSGHLEEPRFAGNTWIRDGVLKRAVGHQRRKLGSPKSCGIFPDRSPRGPGDCHLRCFGGLDGRDSCSRPRQKYQLPCLPPSGPSGNGHGRRRSVPLKLPFEFLLEDYIRYFHCGHLDDPLGELHEDLCRDQSNVWRPPQPGRVEVPKT